ncbi:MAG: inositol monophosphatase [SAR202 cluster bacterium]|nr:inositol monophosphatase [SAR202 cluster bacterium]
MLNVILITSNFYLRNNIHMDIEVTLLDNIHKEAVRLAEGAGKILSDQFGKTISVQFKDSLQRDPVTSADLSTQEYLESEIKKIFPTHGILGEETKDENSESLNEHAADILWVLDPLDGTTNFMNGIPIYASSIGVLYKGLPVAGAIYVPWPGKANGLIIHSQKDAGCYANTDRVSVTNNDKPIGNRLIGLPGSFSQFNKFRSSFKGPIGEPRVTGSIAYELAMTAIGVFQYAIFGAPRMWDMLGGTIAVQEAGGMVMTKSKQSDQWDAITTLIPEWESKTPTLRELRNWVAPIVAGNQSLASLISENITTQPTTSRLLSLPRKLKS